VPFDLKERVSLLIRSMAHTAAPMIVTTPTIALTTLEVEKGASLRVPFISIYHPPSMV
jgi:hypothetical protein